VTRAFVVVLDACGVGALADAASYGDAGTNTLKHVAELAGGLVLPNLQRLGLGRITEIEGVSAAAGPVPGRLINGRLHAIGPGKDSTAGHWALMGVTVEQPLPTYPDGFPPEVVRIITAQSGRELLCNRAYDGIAAIDDFGERHLQTGALIVYTSQDSVLQIAAHEAVYATADLYELCATIRALLPDEHAVGRVIARPFRGTPGAFERTSGRKDLVVDPPTRSYIDTISDAGVEVHTVGKPGALFAGRGISHQHPGATNAEALQVTTALLEQLDRGFVFTNLIETDQVYGHRHDVPGFAGALTEIDAAVGQWLALLRDGDLLILTADHGVDPAASHTDHTREHVPLLAIAREPAAAEPIAGPEAANRWHLGPMADVGASVCRWLTGSAEATLPGTPFV
jgi:phosphopentomutase